MECPHCGAKVPRRAKACPECGSDEETGWASGEDQEYEGVELPDAYDPDRWEREAEEREVRSKRAVAIVVLLVGGLLLGLAVGVAQLVR